MGDGTSLTTEASALMDASTVHDDDNGGSWTVSWHPAPDVPEGTPHGAAGICVTPAGEVVLITPNVENVRWDLPAGRPEADETSEQTLRREMREEACAEVTAARLLGHVRSACIAGPQTGSVLVRSIWRAEVTLSPWKPEYEIVARRCVAPADVRDVLATTWTGGLADILTLALTAASLE